MQCLEKCHAENYKEHTISHKITCNQLVARSSQCFQQKPMCNFLREDAQKNTLFLLQKQILGRKSLIPTLSATSKTFQARELQLLLNAHHRKTDTRE